MDAINSVNAAPPVQHIPTTVPDVRPTADAAALARDPQPDTPMPIPASLGQAAEVTQARLSSKSDTEDVSQVQRVLKPFGVTMLPYAAEEQT